ncbi:hypothetical protein TRICI_005219 [Trichomonascus ciferrii]|uniref:RRM domain-containing protein n=1 Tax=Trichomonascus ciferrii TaxID=44093 RepID=A0A642UUG6_9ASCO|nr:hypothetical protein TRICI_005219 [Trichomonascus ciferrii]
MCSVLFSLFVEASQGGGGASDCAFGINGPHERLEERYLGMNKIREIEKLNEQELEAGVSIKGSWHNDYSDTAYIYIGGLPYNLTEGDVMAIFSQYGNPVHLNLVRDKETGKSKGFAFLKYEDQRSTVLAVDNFNGAQILGRPIRVDHTRYEAKDDEEVKPVSEIEREEEKKEMRPEKEGRSRDGSQRGRSKDEEHSRREKSTDRRRHRPKDSEHPDSSKDRIRDRSRDRERRNRSKERVRRGQSKDRRHRDSSNGRERRHRSNDRELRDHSNDREQRHRRHRKRERSENRYRSHRHKNEGESVMLDQEEDDPELMDPMKDYLRPKKRKS